MTRLTHAPAAPIGSAKPAASPGGTSPTACDSLVPGGGAAAGSAWPRASLPRRLVTTIRLWRRRAQESRDLLGMPDRMLRDMGITRSDAWRAARKPFWRA
jgi:uncharacterized protein YjiS (DUF1127 family)